MPETERQNHGVLSDIEPPFPATCENIPILQIKPQESNAAVAGEWSSVMATRDRRACVP